MMSKKFYTILILLLLAWNGQASENASHLLSEQASDFPVVERNSPVFDTGELGSFSDGLESSNFSALENETSPLKQQGQENLFEVLPPDKAFVFSTYLENPTLLVARWQMPEGYYLYRDQFQFALLNGGVLGKAQFPTGIFKEDAKYGRVEVYEQALEIKLPITDSQSLKSLTLKTTYQGCAEDRLCYPPIEKTVNVDLPEIVQANEGIPLESENAENEEATTSELSTTPQSESVLTQMGQFLGLGKETNQFLPADEVFIFSAEFPEPTFLKLHWQIAEGYYLYQDKLKFALENGGELGTPQLPPAILKKDPVFGDVYIYQQPELDLTIPIQAKGQQTVTLKVDYQGCAVAGYCYPPMSKIVKLTLGESDTISEQDRLANLLANANMLYTILIFFGLGLLLSLTPCVFPMIPILSSIIVGQGSQVTTYKAFLMSLIYVVAMAFTYAIVGVLTASLGENLNAAFQTPWVLISFALIFVALSLSMFGFYELQLPNSLQTKLTVLSNRQQGGTFIGVAIMGVLSALIVGPCVAAPLVGALIYIAQTGDKLLGGLALFFMALGMGIPLILIGISAGHWLPKADQWMDSVKAVFGVMLLAVAIWMVERVIPGQIVMILWATLLIISAVYMGALESIPASASGWRKLWKGLGLIFLIYGVLLMVGAASGHHNPLQPLYSLNNSNNQVTETANVNQTLQFKPIKGISGLERELAAAKAQNKPVMLDFYADWCISCKEMEHFTFSNADVQQSLTHFVLLKADVTPNDEPDKALYKRFGIFGPPAILFFDTNGTEQRNYRVVGFMPADKFNQHLSKVIQP
jgi:thioredoxin:protein disulfide reductase